MRLDDDDLAEIAAQASQDHLLAISERETLSEQVTDVLVTRGDQKVVHSLAGNGGARFSGYGFKTLVERADGDETLQEKIGSRSDLPQPLLKSLMRIASERVRQRLIAKREPTEQPDRFSRMVEEVAAPTPKRPLDYALADAAIDDLQRAGQLNEEGVARLVAAQRDCQVIAALSRLASLPAPTIESLWTPEQSQGLVMLTKALGFSARTTREIARLAMADWGTADALDEVMRNFDRLSLTTAQRIVRFWKVRSTAQAEVERKTGDVHFVPA